MKSEKNHIRVGCGCIILNEKEEVLLLKRSKILENEPGMWSRPGGTVKFGESVEEALKREVKEEIYVDIEIVRFLEYTEIINEKEGKHWIALGFLAKIKSGEVKNLEP
ncbi:MAG: NUDIX domain-containing protein, partial [Methanosarcinales archaeon]